MIYNNSKYNSDWEIKKLEQLGEFGRGKSKHRPRNDPKLFEQGSYPLIQTGDITSANLFIRNHSTSYNEFGLKQSKLWDANTLCITIAANIAETALLGYPMCFPDSVVGFNAFPNESSELFMHYVFTFIKKSIKNSASGSIQDNINIEYLTSLKLRIPQKKYQDKIVSIISTLDAKIELNNRINAELEQMAKTLYDYWFVQFDFPVYNHDGTLSKAEGYKSSGGKMVWCPELNREVPEGWEVKRLENVISLIIDHRGKTPLKLGGDWSESRDGIIALSAKHVKGGKLIKLEEANIVTSEMFDKWMPNKLQEGDILMTSEAPCGEFYLILNDTNYCLSQRLFAIRTNQSEVYSSYLYFELSKGNGYSQILGKQSGSTVFGIRQDELRTVLVLKPTTEIQRNFHDKVKSMLFQIRSNEIQNRHLSSLRDWLLPMLMNGQVKVGETKRYKIGDERLGMVAEP